MLTENNNVMRYQNKIYHMRARLFDTITCFNYVLEFHVETSNEIYEIKATCIKI